MPSDRVLYLLGAGDMRTRLLAQLLEQQLRCSVHAVGSPLQVPDDRPGSLLLIDASALTEDGLGELLHPFAARRVKPQVALLDVDENLAIDFVLMSPMIRGVFLRSSDPARLPSGVEAMFRGEQWFPRNIASLLLDALRQRDGCDPEHGRGPQSLTARERRVLSLIGDGYSNIAIADQLHVSIHTVKTHVYNVFRKLDISNRVQAANLARQMRVH